LEAVNPYLIAPLTACVTSGMLAVLILARDPEHRVNRIAAALTMGAVTWSFCEVLWNSARDPAVVLQLVRASAIGWVAIGPLALHLFLELSGRRRPLARRVLPALYLVSAVFLAIDLLTPWIHPGVMRTSWGWGYALGPAYPSFYLFTVSCIVAGLAIAAQELRRPMAPSERTQVRWLVAGLLVPLVLASLTDGILPYLGHQVPRLGTASFTVLGAAIAWCFYRHGYSLLVPGTFAAEILAALSDGVALLWPDGRVRSANAAMARLCGVASPRALEGLAAREWLPGLEGDLLAQRGESECSLEGRGGPIPVSVSTSVLCDKPGDPIGVVLAVRDLREVANLRSRLVTSGRLAAVGQLAAGIAHEINNPIAFVRANLGTLRSLLSALTAKLGAEAALRIAADLADGRDLVDESLDGVERVVSIVRDVKGFSHAGATERECVDLNAVLESVLRVATPQLRCGGPVERCYGEIPPVLGTRQELEQVFLNLVINASQAVAGDGAIRIETTLDGPTVVAVVEDDGCGIPPDAMSRIFDPFFTTKPVGEGTGLGLAISYQIVRSHGGHLAVESAPGCGTRVRVELPAAGPGLTSRAGSTPDSR
jgi:signal transduction histidine kinase